jgi:hypothetical protein
VGERRPSNAGKLLMRLSSSALVPLSPSPLPALRWRGEGEAFGAGIEMRHFCLGAVGRHPPPVQGSYAGCRSLPAASSARHRSRRPPDTVELT